MTAASSQDQPNWPKLFWQGFGLLIVISFILAIIQPVFDRITTSDGDIAAEIYQKNSEWQMPAENCVEAGKVADAYLRDRDQSSYEHWKRVESRYCNRAMMCAQIIGGCTPDALISSPQ